MRYANIKWDITGCPHSLDFNDLYFSSSGAIEEKTYVFLRQNDLPLVWHEKEFFVIGECGFGFGLNFLLTLKEWRDDNKRCKKLLFFSCDNLPVPFEDLKILYSLLPRLKHLGDELLEFYKTLKKGVNKFYFGNVLLILVINDALNAIKDFDDKVNVWFFYGFTPSLNTSIWSKEVIETAAQKSNSKATFSTYTVSGTVKRSFESAGFMIKKVKGFGKKREILKGIYVNI